MNMKLNQNHSIFKSVKSKVDTDDPKVGKVSTRTLLSHFGVYYTVYLVE